MTFAGLVGVSLLLSLLPFLPDGARPFPTLLSDPKHAFLAALWPRAVAPQAPKALAVLEEVAQTDEQEDAQLFPEVEIEVEDGAPRRREPPPLTAREQSQRRAWTKALEQLGAPGSPVADPCLEWTKTGCARTGLEPFFNSLAEVRDGKRQVSRIVVFGTSLIASDHITDVARQVLQRQHGNAGKGLLYLDRPTRGAGRTVRTGEATEEWLIEKLTDEKPRDDLGLTGVAFTSPPDKPQRAKFDVTHHALAQIYAVAEPKGGVLQVLVDGKVSTEFPVAGEATEPLFFRVELQGAKKLELVSQGKVRIDAVSIESAQPGVVLDSLGLPGSSARVLMRANDDVLRPQLKHRDPSLIVVMMGGNEAYELSEGRYGDEKARNNLERLIDRLREIVPRAACLLASPPDAGVFKLDKTITFREQTKVVARMMREVASKKGCGYYDMQAAMGGEGAVARWYEAKLMNEDLVHPLGAGGDLMGWLFATSLEAARTKRQQAVAPKTTAQQRWAGVLRPAVLAQAGGSEVRGPRSENGDSPTLDAGTRRRRAPDSGVDLRPDGGVRRRRAGSDAGIELLADGGVRRRRAVPDGGVELRADGGVRRRRAVSDAGDFSDPGPRPYALDGGSRWVTLYDGGVRWRGAEHDDDAGVRWVELPDGGFKRRRVPDAGASSDLGPRTSDPTDSGFRYVVVFDGGRIPTPTTALKPEPQEVRPPLPPFIQLPDGGVRRTGGPGGGFSPEEWIRLADGGFRRRSVEFDAGLAGAAPPPMVAHPGIENPDALVPFFQKLEALEREKQGRVAVAQLGASHTASQFFTDEARALMTERFGYAGRGYVAPGKPLNRLEATGVSRQLTGRWEIKDAVRVKTPNLVWGLTGMRATGHPGASVTVAFDEPDAAKNDTSRIQVFMLDAPDGGRAEVLVDGQLAQTRPPPTEGTAHVGILDFTAPGATHAVTVRNAGPGKLSVLGISHELLRPGLLWDSLGLPGSTIVTLNRYERNALEAQLSARAPALYVMFYGTNEAGRALPYLEHVKTAWPEVLTTLKRSAPDAACVLLGPTDRLYRKRGRWTPAPSTREVYEVLRAVGKEHGCAVWSAWEAMGGPGSMEVWRGFEPPWANKDRVHLTQAGYRALAGAFVGDLLGAYDSWRVSR